MELEDQEREIEMEYEPFINGGGVTYTAGYGIDIDEENEISVDTNEIQEKLTAGENITIENNVISATASSTTVTELTSDDYNYPEENPDGVALWSLPTGLYSHNENVKVYASSSLYSQSENGLATVNNYDEEPTLSSTANIEYLHGNGRMDLLKSIGGYQLPPINETKVLLENDVVQNTGNSTAMVMSQNATTSMAFADPTTKRKVQIGDGATAGGNNSTAVGRNAKANGNNSLALGFGSTASGLVSYAMGGTATNDYSLAFGVGSTTTGDNALALGNTAIASGLNSVALGYKSKATAQGEINVGLDGRTDGYGNTAYRLISGVHDPVNAQDAANKEYVDNIVVNYATLTAAGTPTTSTAAVSVGQLYYDSTNDDYYYCSAIDTTDPQNPSYTWSALSTGGGGGGPTVVQTTGTSQTDVMSQNAATSMVFADPANATKVSIGNSNAGTDAVSIGRSAYGAGNYSVSLGYQSNTYNGSGAVAVGQGARARASNSIAIGYTANQGLDGGTNSVAIGSSAKANTSGSVSIGYNTSVLGADNIALGSSAQTSGSVINATALGTNSLASHRGSVALGSSAQTSSKGQIMVGTTNTYDGYNSTNYRLVSGVYDGQGANDAVNVGQVNSVIDQINTALSTNIPHIGA